MKSEKAILVDDYKFICLITARPDQVGHYIRSSSILNPFLGYEQLDGMGNRTIFFSSSSSFFRLQTSISWSQSDKSEKESESESDSGTGAEEQLSSRFSVRLSRSLGLTLAWQVLRCVLSEDGEVQEGAGQSGQPCE